MISTVEAERDAILTEKKSTHLNADKIKMLAKLKAIGAEFSTTLVGEVFYREFANRRDAWHLPARGRNADDEIDSAVKEIGFHPVKPANRLRGPGSIYVIEDQSFYHPVCPVHAAAGNSESEVFAPPDPTFAP
jgi:hypothetical protein